MCTGAEIGLILTAVGTGTQAINANQALRRQDRQAAEGIRRQGQIQERSNQRVGEQIDDLAASTGEQERAQRLAGFRDALRDVQSSTEGSLPGDAAIGQANPRFAERVSQNVRRIAGDRNAQAGRLSVIDAAADQRMNEGNRLGRTVTDINELGRQSRAEDFLTKLRVAQERPNEFVDILGGLASGVGSAMTLGATGPNQFANFKKLVPNFMRGGPNLGGLANAGTLVDAPTTLVNPFSLRPVV